jgi:hypothetical protein
MPPTAYVGLLHFCIPSQPFTALSPTAADVRVYTHEFAGIFRFSHDTIIELGQLAVLEKVDPRSTMPDDEQGVIFVAREIMARVAQKTMPIQLRKRMSQRSAQRRRVRG